MASYFDQNGSRQIYSKFREEDSRERTLHNIVFFFISMHLPTVPLGRASNVPETDLITKKSNLKLSSSGRDYAAKVLEAQS